MQVFIPSLMWNSLESVQKNRKKKRKTHQKGAHLRMAQGHKIGYAIMVGSRKPEESGWDVPLFELGLTACSRSSR